MKKYIKLMRVHHYIKNGVILLPLIFSMRLGDISLLTKTIIGVIAFCIISSAVYIINDIKDLESDRRHITKRNRPLASGEVSIKSAWVLASCLFVAAVFINIFASNYALNSWFYLFAYIAFNYGYSCGLKNVPIVDVMILASGFLLRVLYGSAISGIDISSWLYLTVIALSFYLSLGKRRNELTRQKTGQTSRKALQYYSYDFLDKIMYLCLTLAISFYSLWSIDPLTIQRISSTYLLWTVPLAIIIFMKYSLTIEGGSEGDPIEIIIKDRILLLLIGLFAVIVLSIIYL
ncbi:MAG: decaprenyl-phosphate phosphoribosyltransferase [Candidatus Neomarinimicrobiota bacterium]